MVAAPLTVLCVCVGTKYPDEYVLKLQSMVARHLSIEHEFKCISDREIAGVSCIPSRDDWPGWWRKVELFRPGATGPFFYLDLDMVIVRSLDWIADYFDKGFATIENWGSRPRQGPLYEDELSSALMIWSGNGETDRIYSNFREADIRRLHPHGDQTYITEQMRGAVTLIPQERMASYKRHCRDQGAPPDAASVVAFHGVPAPHECSEQWVKDNWR